MSRRRRGNANEMTTILWRDIPAQVKTSFDGQKGSWLLPPRFEVAIDRAAAVAGLTSEDDYIREWRRVTGPCAGDPQATAEAEVERLDQEYTSERIKALVAQGGLDNITEKDTESP